jgi:protein arginine N-methyltransferase 1
MYSVAAYGTMIADRVRVGAYARALRQAVEPGAIVVDIGTGTGIMALLACKYGAKRVFAIEPADAVTLAREIAQANGFADRIEFIQDFSTRVTLPERADVVVSDLRGVLPLHGHHIPAIVDARRRFLEAGGSLIPRRDVIRVAVAAAPDLYAPHVSPWEDAEHGIDMRAARRLGVNDWGRSQVRPNHLLLEPRPWATLDYATIDHADVSAEVGWRASRAGTGHGLVLWFDADLGHGVALSNAPGQPELVYGQAFFPWSQPVDLATGDTISVSLRATLVGEDYVWCWDTRVEAGALGRFKADFRQSTFFAAPLSPSTLARRSADHVPALNEDGCIDRLILECLVARVPLGHIADRVLASFPARFAGRAEAMTRVGDLSARYSL